MELNRAVRGCQFYPDAHPQLKEMLERSLRSWRGNLESYGALDLEVRRGNFRLLGSKLAIGKGTLDELAREFALRGIRRIRAEREYPDEAFNGLLDLLTSDAESIREQGGASQWLEKRRVLGLQINEINLHKHLEEPSPVAAPAAADAEVGGMESVPGLLASLFSNPSEAAENQPNDSLRELLGFLDAPQSDDAYTRRMQTLVEHVRALCEPSKLCRTRFDVLSVLAHHVGEAATRSAIQRHAAQSTIAELCPHPVLLDLIAHAFCAENEEEASARAILLALREHCAAAVLESIEQEHNPQQREQLQNFLMDLRDAAIPALTQALRHGSSSQIRIAIRIAGLMGIRSAVPQIVTLLENEQEDVYKEATYALVRIGDERAFLGLCEALHSPRREISSLAIFGLGAWGKQEALSPLLSELHEALSRAPIERIQELLRAIGRLEQPAAIPELTRLLKKRSFLRKRRLLDIQLAAVAALGRISGEEAQWALMEASQHRKKEIRQAAEQALRHEAMGEL